MNVRFAGYQWPPGSPRPRAITFKAKDDSEEVSYPASAEFDDLSFHGEWRPAVFSRAAKLLSRSEPGGTDVHPSLDPGTSYSRRGLCCLYNGLEVNIDPGTGYVFPCDTPDTIDWWRHAVHQCLEQLNRLGLSADDLHESEIADLIWPESPGSVDKDEMVNKVLSERRRAQNGR